MSDIQPPSDAELRLLRQNFAEESVTQELSGALDDERPKHAIGLGELYNYAHENLEHTDTVKIETALASSPAIRNAFRRIITGMVFYRSGEALAASDPGPIPRSGNGFSIRYQTANTVPGHIYVIIELDGKTILNCIPIRLAVSQSKNIASIPFLFNNVKYLRIPDLSDSQS